MNEMTYAVSTMYTAYQAQPIIQYGSGGPIAPVSGYPVLLTSNYINNSYAIQLTYSNPIQPMSAIYISTASVSSFKVFGHVGANFYWTTFGGVPQPLAARTSSLTIGPIVPPSSPTSNDGYIDVILDTANMATGGVAPYTSVTVYCSNGESKYYIIDGSTQSQAFGDGTNTPAGTYTFYFVVTDSATPTQNTATSGNVSATVVNMVKAAANKLTLGIITDDTGSGNGSLQVSLDTDGIGLYGYPPYTLNVTTEIETWQPTADSGIHTHTFLQLSQGSHNINYTVTDSSSMSDSSVPQSYTVPYSPPPALAATSSSLTVTGTTDDSGPGDGTISVSLNTYSLATGGFIPYNSVTVNLSNSTANIIEFWSTTVGSGTQTNTFGNGTNIPAGSYNVYFIITDSNGDMDTSSNIPVSIGQAVSTLLTQNTALQVDTTVDNLLLGGTDGKITITINSPYALGGTPSYILQIYCKNSSDVNVTGSPLSNIGTHTFDNLAADTYSLYFTVTDSGLPAPQLATSLTNSVSIG